MSSHFKILLWMNFYLCMILQILCYCISICSPYQPISWHFVECFKVHRFEFIHHLFLEFHFYPSIRACFSVFMFSHGFILMKLLKTLIIFLNLYNLILKRDILLPISSTRCSKCFISILKLTYALCICVIICLILILSDFLSILFLIFS